MRSKNGNGKLLSDLPDTGNGGGVGRVRFGDERVWLSPAGGEFGLGELARELARFMAEEAESSYRLVIGSDSQTKRWNGASAVDFVTAVVIHRVGKGARYFWRKEREEKRYFLRDKIYRETMLSLEVAQVLVPELRRVLNGEKYTLEIHIDVGQAGPTREMIAEVVGMVTGNGFLAKTKPESWGASTVADKYA